MTGLAALVALVACGGNVQGSGRGPHIDVQQLESLLVQRQQQRYPGLHIGQARCPDGVAARRGETFQCTVDVEGQPAAFRVTLSQVVGEQVRYDFRALQAIVDVTSVVTFLRTRLEDDWRSAGIDCGRAKGLVANVGSAIDCTVSNGATTRHIQAVVEDVDGAVSLRER